VEDETAAISVTIGCEAVFLTAFTGCAAVEAFAGAAEAS
jgi:hypothetical protein